MNPVEEAVDDLIAQLPSRESQRAYRSDWDRFVRWLVEHGETVTTARPKHVQRYVVCMQSEGKAKASIGRALSVIREVYGALVREEIIDVNPARETKNIKVGAEPRAPVLSEEQVSEMLNLSRNSWKERRAHVCLCLLFGLGWRRSEVAALRVEDFIDGTVTGVVKGGKQLTVGVPQWVQEAVTEWRDYAALDEGALLPRAPDNPEAVSDNIVYAMVKDTASRAGLQASPHVLRRSNITLGGERGVSLKERQLSVGHASQSTTERYDKARNAAKNTPGQVFADMIQTKPLPALADIFENVFYGDSRYRSSAEAINALAIACREKKVKVKRVELPKTIDPKMLTQFTGKSQEHRMLCASAALWLDRQGKKWWAQGGRCQSAAGVADVVAQDSSVFVEAGHTTADKVIAYLRAKQPLLLVPYGFDCAGFLLTGDVPETEEEHQQLLKAFEQMPEVGEMLEKKT